MKRGLVVTVELGIGAKLEVRHYSESKPGPRSLNFEMTGQSLELTVRIKQSSRGRLPSHAGRCRGLPTWTHCQPYFNLHWPKNCYLLSILGVAGPHISPFLGTLMFTRTKFQQIVASMAR